VVVLYLGGDLGKDKLMALVGFSAGGLLGGAFLHLIPESFAAGNFVYIAGSDLVPELLDQKDLGKGLAQFGLMALGVLLMYLVKFL
jgi:zinc and cadmium transporter